ncbi:hypothetical protein, partial [Stenotrophomonas maltophilia group sp. Smal41]|uniref:hypothetical protein n=1 Tax=Stenotrophomonas maltophilia group sp. Smal41 TaxID=3377168 RepID=UPI00300EFDE6
LHDIHYAKCRIRRIWAFVGSAWQWLVAPAVQKYATRTPPPSLTRGPRHHRLAWLDVEARMPGMLDGRSFADWSLLLAW